MYQHQQQVKKDYVLKALDEVNILHMSTVNKDSALKALVKVNLLHKSSAPYLPPCRNRV